MEWIIVLAAIAALIYWLSRTQGVGGAIARMIIRAIPRPKNGIDNRMLPRAFIGGVVLAIVAGGLRILDLTSLSFVVGLAIGPFIGGMLIRSWWWVVIAGAVGSSLVAGGEIRPLYVALPVALIAYGGIRWTTPKRLRSDSSPADPR